MASFTVKPNKEDLQFLKQLIEAGKVTPVIDRTYPLSETPEAIRYLESGHARGKGRHPRARGGSVMSAHATLPIERRFSAMSGEPVAVFQRRGGGG